MTTAAAPEVSGRPDSWVLVLNSGSSSVKFALVLPGSGERLMAGMGERLGTPEAILRVQWLPAAAVEERLPGGTHRAVVTRVLEHVAAASDGGVRLLGAGHRVVHGGERFSASIRVDDAVLSALRSISHLAPLNNPANLAGIDAISVVLPELPQVAVFDTASQLPVASAGPSFQAAISSARRSCRGQAASSWTTDRIGMPSARLVQPGQCPRRRPQRYGARVSPVAGSGVSNDLPEAASVHFPSMNS